MNRFTQDQKDIITGAYFDKLYKDLSDEEREELSCECDTELWYHFLEVETDPESVHEMYITLFDPGYHQKMDIFDHLWNILIALSPPGINTTYLQVLAVTGRVEELAKYLKEFSDGIPEKK